MLNILGLIFVGLIIGLLARLLLPGKQKLGLIPTLILGVAGALIGGIIASQIGRGDIFELNVVGFIVAVIAAIVLLAIAERAGMAGGSRRGDVRGSH